MYKTLLKKKQKQIHKSSAKKYVFAVIATILCLLIQVALKPIFGPMQYFLLFPLVFITSALGGIGPALVVIILGGVGANQLIPDPLIHMKDQAIYSVTWISLGKFFIFAFASLIGAWILHLTQQKYGQLLLDINRLSESDQQFKILADASPVLIWMTDENKVATWYNKNWREFIGFDLEESISINMEDLVHPEDVKEAVRIFNQAIDNREEFRSEYRLKNKNGEYRWLLTQARPMYNGNDYLGYVGTCIDINEHKVSEEKIKKALQSRDHFLAVASHELKTPIASLNLIAEVFKRMLAAEDGKFTKDKMGNMADQISRQVFRLDRLINDMLDNSRINSGKFTVNPEKFNMAEAVKEIIDGLKNRFTNRIDGTPDISLKADQANYEGSWDRVKVDQVITNLLTNAIKYGNKKAIEVEIIITDEDMIRISVTDSGIGIGPHDLDKVFTRFYRVDPGASEGGLGLGLFISKQIVRAHQGAIWAESTLGKGSRFIVELPRITKQTNEDYHG